MDKEANVDSLECHNSQTIDMFDFVGCKSPRYSYFHKGLKKRS